MATYYTLLELELEDPVQAGPEPQRVGFTTTAEAIRVDPGGASGGGLRHFGPGLHSVRLPGRRGDFYSGASTTTGNPSITISLDDFDAVALFRQDVRLQQIRARVYWWTEGQTLAQAEQVWRGRVTAPDIDPDRGVFRCTLTPGTRQIDTQFPPGLIGDADRFPNAPDSAKGVPLPVVYGLVRNLPIYPIGDDSVGASPPDGATNVRYIIAGHEIPLQLYQAKSDGGLSTGLTAPSYANDGKGGRYSYIDIANTVAGWTSGQAVYLSPAVAGYVAPGFTPGVSSQYIKKLGDVLIHIVNTYSKERFFELDRERIYAARSHLNRFSVGMWFNAQGGAPSLLQILKSRIEPQFPVSFNFSGGRFGWDYTGITEDHRGVGSLVYGQNAHTRSSLRPVSIDVLRSRFNVSYGGDGHAGGATESVTRDASNSALCRSAKARWDNNLSANISAPDVTDENSALQLVEDQMIRLTKRRSRITYTADEPTWVGLPLFSRLLVTDETWGWVNEPFIVESVIPLRPGQVQLGLLTENGL